MTSRNYCFTLNNYEALPDLDHADIKYAIYQEEIGQNGTPHIQGYLELTKSVRMAYVKALNNGELENAHFERRRGTQQQAIDYCRKRDETDIDGPYEFGEKAQQGERSDIMEFSTAIKRGDSEKILEEQHTVTFFKYYKMIPIVRNLAFPDERPAPEVIFYYGPPSTGKTTLVNKVSPKGHWKSNDDKWFDGYNGEQDLIIDEFYGWLPYAFMLRLLDKFPLRVEGKGTTIVVQSKRIYITSNRLPTDWYKHIIARGSIDIQALIRRFTKIFYVPEIDVCIDVTEQYKLNRTI